MKEGKVARKGLLADKLAQALLLMFWRKKKSTKIVAADKLRYTAIQVDHFSHDFSETWREKS